MSPRRPVALGAPADGHGHAGPPLALANVRYAEGAESNDEMSSWPCVALLGLAACHQRPASPDAPRTEGVCWRADPAPPHVRRHLSRGRARPRQLRHGPRSGYLGRGPRLVGAYQGNYIFVGPDKFQSAQGLDLFRYPLFTPAQRAALDSQLRVVLAARTLTAAGAKKP